jgi:SAM-dependent methyltransferase
MGWYGDRVLPLLIDRVCGLPRFHPLRRELVDGVDGTVLELGFGSGLTLPWYPAEVERLLDVDPSARGRELARERIAAAPFPVDHVGRDGAHLHLEDHSVDHVVAAFTLCSIPDLHGALAQVRRVLRPEGTFRFLEHGLSDDPGVARWQRRLTPLQRRVAGGCHLDRPVLDEVRAAGFTIEASRQWSDGRPKVLSAMVLGIARP